MDTKPVRLQKFLAARGVASRRAAEAMIAAGRVTVNDRVVTEMGTSVRPGQDRIAVDGNELAEERETTRTVVLNKPRGYVCSRNRRQGRSVFELVADLPERLVCVGRLDKESEGLLLLSNDGDFVQQLTHPRYEHSKVYRVAVSGKLDDEQLRKLNSAMYLDGYRIRPARVKTVKWNHKQGAGELEFTLKEGRNRQVRRMCAAVGLQVQRLVRTRIQNLELGDLASGKWRDVSAQDRGKLDVT